MEAVGMVVMTEKPRQVSRFVGLVGKTITRRQQQQRGTALQLRRERIAMQL
jgi:hypothetical protein